MATQAATDIGHIPAAGRPPVPVALPLLAFALLLYWINPVGYVGGGGDDWQYLIASECWAAGGPCLPHDHWWARWPLVAPMAAAIAALGESRAALALVPLLYSAAVLLLLARIVERVAGRSAALVAGCALLLTPIFAIQLGRPNIDHPELAFLLVALLGWIEAVRGGGRRWGLLLGAGLAFAMLARETSAVFIAGAGIAFLCAPAAHKRELIWAVPAFVLPVAAEMLVYLAATGDPFHRLHLAFGHTRIPSTELASWVDTSRSAFFNPDFIAGWRAANGIEAHWTVKPLVNLVTHAEIGLTLLAAPLLLAAAPRQALGTAADRRMLLVLLAITAGAGLVFTYALGLDPKPRMFLPLAAVSSAVVGVAAVALWREGRRLVPAATALFFIPSALLCFAGTPGISRAERQAAAWLEAVGPLATTNETARRHLAMVPAARALPVEDEARPYRLAILWEGCTVDGEPGAEVVRRASLQAGEWAPVAWLRARSIGLHPEAGPWLCLTRRARRAPL
ncbi:MAG TPA: glycosyltransferase family 39 protein [Allosphingosinicella sp.]|jgi:4-amino-4-deoxy-L-arabinose transferase-like glycosyltransferase